MSAILYTLIFIIGTLFGSFFTLAVYRIPLGKDITHERSFCPKCNHRLEFLDMIPILSYIFLRGKCRYCKQKIRPRYLLLEVFSGIVFVLFAMSLKLNVVTTTMPTWIYFIFGILYFVTLLIIAGIDKEKLKIEKSILLFGYIVEALYIIYLYIVEKDFNMYRYVIYLTIIILLSIIDIFILRKKVKSNYTIDILLLCMMLLNFTYELVNILTILFTLICISIQLIIQKICTRKNKSIRIRENISNIPIGYYLCITNIICLIITNFYIFN